MKDLHLFTMTQYIRAYAALYTLDIKGTIYYYFLSQRYERDYVLFRNAENDAFAIKPQSLRATDLYRTSKEHSQRHTSCNSAAYITSFNFVRITFLQISFNQNVTLSLTVWKFITPTASILILFLHTLYLQQLVHNSNTNDIFHIWWAMKPNLVLKHTTVPQTQLI